MIKADAIFEGYRDRFAQHFVEIRKSYIYIYADGSGQSKVRPSDDYTFNIDVTMHEQHRDHSINLNFTLPISEGFSGKTEYVGGESECFERELREELEYYLDKIRQFGFTEVYEREQKQKKGTAREVRNIVLLIVCGVLVVAIAMTVFSFLA